MPWRKPPNWASLASTIRSNAMLADPDIDVVHLATPNVLHYPHAKAALLAGKHVVCEKPLAMTSTESAELVKLVGRKAAR